MLVSTENLKLMEIYWQIKPLIFSAHQNLDEPKIPKYFFNFDLFRHANSSLTATRVFISSTKVAIKEFPLLRIISASNCPFRCFRLTFDSPKKSRNIFQYQVFSIFNASLFKWSVISAQFMDSISISTCREVSCLQQIYCHFVEPVVLI